MPDALYFKLARETKNYLYFGLFPMKCFRYCYMYFECFKRTGFYYFFISLISNVWIYILGGGFI